jgi:hypothetical protein
MLLGLRLIKKVHPITHTGEIISTNDIYQSRHWSTRHNAEGRLEKIFEKLLKEQKAPKVTEFGLVMFYNNTMDVCNLTFMEKVFIDSFRLEKKTTILRDKNKKEISRSTKIIHEGYVLDDTQKHFKFLVICPDKNLPKSTVEFNLCVL